MPKRIDPASQRRLIADAAIRVINDAGLEGARLRDVARAARVTTGAVTHYFDGKDEVVVAALEEIVRRTLTRLEAARGDNAPKDIDTFIAQVCSYLPLDAPRCGEWRVWLAFWGRAIADDRLRAVHRRHYEAIIDNMIAPLRGLATGAARSKAELRSVADAVMAAIDGVGARATLEPELWPPKRQRETLTFLLTPVLTDFVGS